MSDLPLIGITMGDPAGIGPEIIVRALEEGDVYRYCRPLVLGDPAILSSVFRILSSSRYHESEWNDHDHVAIQLNQCDQRTRKHRKHDETT